MNTGVWHIAVWRSDTPGCELTNDDTTLQLIDTFPSSADTEHSSRNSVVCMSASASVKSGHSISFHLSSSHNAAAAAVGMALVLSELDGVGLSVSDRVNMDTDDVIFYSFHGHSPVMFAHLALAFVLVTSSLVDFVTDCKDSHYICCCQIQPLVAEPIGPGGPRPAHFLALVGRPYLCPADCLG